MSQETDEAFQRAYAETDAIIAGLPGASTMIEHFGGVPGFHDAQIHDLHLVTKGVSTITFEIGQSHIPGELPIRVTFHFQEILDVQLDNFSPQNIIGDLFLRPHRIAETRRNYLWRQPTDDDIEIELEPIYGMSGRIVGGGLSVSWQQTMPAR